MAAVQTSFDVDTLRAAMERGDADRLTDLFRDDAECVLIDKEHPPSRPMRRHGREEIAELNRYLLGGEKTHRVEELVASGDTVAYADACEYPDGTRVYCGAFLEVEDGRISRQVCVQAWDE